MSCSLTSRKLANLSVVYDEPKPDYKSPEYMRNDVLTPDEAKELLEGMSGSVGHGALSRTRFDLNGLQIKGYGTRVQNNPKLTRLGKWLHQFAADEFEGAMPDKTQGMGDLYMPFSDVVSSPSGIPGYAMHELGHAIDFNEYPHESPIRQLMAATYRNYSPTLWQEHAAWRKGRAAVDKALLEGRISLPLARKTLKSARGGKRIGLGSYWGSALGGTVGGGLGLAGGIALLMALDRQGVELRGRGVGQLMALPAVIGAVGGAAAGAGVGHWSARREPDSEKVLDDMVTRLARKTGKSKAEVASQININAVKRYVDKLPETMSSEAGERKKRSPSKSKPTTKKDTFGKAAGVNHRLESSMSSSSIARDSVINKAAASLASKRSGMLSTDIPNRLYERERVVQHRDRGWLAALIKGKLEKEREIQELISLRNQAIGRPVARQRLLEAAGRDRGEIINSESELNDLVGIALESRFPNYFSHTGTPHSFPVYPDRAKGIEPHLSGDERRSRKKRILIEPVQKESSMSVNALPLSVRTRNQVIKRAAMIAYTAKLAAAAEDDEKKDKKDRKPPSNRKERKEQADKILNMDSLLGRGADYLALPWGGERAGRATQLSRGAGKEPSFNLRHPSSAGLIQMLLGGAGGAAIGGLTGFSGGLSKNLTRTDGYVPAFNDTGIYGLVGAAGGAGLGALLAPLIGTYLRRKEMKRAKEDYVDSGTSNPEVPEFSQAATFLAPLRGPHRMGQLQAYEAMTGRSDGLETRSHWNDVGYLAPAIMPVGSGIAPYAAQNIVADDIAKSY